MKSSKCHLFRASVPFLGHIVGRRGLECDPKKIEDVKSWPVPDCLKSVRQFLGFVGYYRRFIPKFADIATPLVYLTGKDVPFVLWFTAELNAKDHIEGIHKFKEGHGTSFYECLRRHGMEWFGSRTFFDQRKSTNQAIWMDMALARRSGQELRNSYIITNSTEHAPLRRFFKASVQPKSLLIQMREAVADCDDVSSDGSLMLLSPPHDIPEVTFPAESSMDQETRDEVSPVVIPRRVTPANHPLQHLEAYGPVIAPYSRRDSFVAGG